MALLKRLLFIALFSMSFTAHAFPLTVLQWRSSGYTAGSAAQAAALGLQGKGTQVWVCSQISTGSGGSINFHCTGNLGGNQNTSASPVTYGCPDGATQSGQTCSCDAGYVEESGTCSPKQQDPCELLADMCAGSAGMSNNFSMDGKKAGISFTCMAPVSVGIANPLPGCNKGCMAAVGGFTTAIQSSEGKWVTQGSAKYVGSTCDPSVINDLNGEADPEYVPEENPKITPESDKTCTNGFPGQVNGITVCVPPKASSGVTQIEEKDNGDGTKTNSKTEVKCENGKCEVTKTSTTTNTSTGGTVNSSSTTTTVDKGAYCSENKTAGACKDEKGENEEGNGSFGGSCQAGFTCKGDAAMCAVAKEQHKRNCQMLEEDKDPASFFNQVKKGTDGKSAQALQDAAEKINISTQLNTSGSGLPRSCPADMRIDLPFANKSFVIPFSLVCPLLKTMSDVALLITALSLLVWLVQGKKEES